MNELVSITQHKARKVHYCNECRYPILRGCEYLSIYRRQDKNLLYKKTHIHCDAVINAYCTMTNREMVYDQLDAVVKWLRDAVCSGCAESGSCRRAGQDTFSCPIALRRVLPPTILHAALRSVEDNKEECL